jgi:two-component system, cell cycle sensor histidine kinase and response regulator CckA
MNAEAFPSIVEDTAAATAVVRDGGVIYANRALRRMFGWPPGEPVERMSVAQLFDPAERGSVELLLEENGSEGSLPGAVEITAVKAGGARFAVIASCSRVAVPGGQARCLVLTDISRRKLVEDSLAQQASLLDNAIDAIIVRDMNDTLLCWNKAAAQLFGVSFAEARGIPLLEMTVPEDRGRLGEAHASVLSGGTWEGEIRFATRDRRRLTVQLRLALMRGADGTPVSRMVSARDITAQRAVEAQFLRAQRLESIGTLAGGIAHDLNNILAPILMGVESVGLTHGDAQTRSTLEIMRSSAQRGAGIVRQVLGFARGLEERRGEIQVRHIVREIEQMLFRTFPKSIEIVTRVPRDLWTVLGDGTQLHQVLMNLCVNARDAMPDGGRLCLSADNVRPGQECGCPRLSAGAIPYVRISVEDTGTGIPREVKERIFDPFFTTKDPGKGTGLGLSTSLSIVQSYGGFMDVDTAAGKGSIFNVFFPAVTERAVETDDEEEAIPLGRGELILVIDDESSVREITRQTLESYGYTVATAQDGTEAVGIFAEKRDEVQAVITDVMMPFMDGAATVRALRRMKPQVKIIVMSGLLSTDEGKGMNGLHLQAFLAKPFTAQVLLKTLSLVLDSTD